MTRMSTEMLQRHLKTWRHAEPDSNITEWLAELVERRGLDLELARLRAVVGGYIERNGRPPTDATKDLCALIDDVLVEGLVKS